MSRKAGLVPSRFDAVAFDLDGVITDTARIHFQAWQQTFECFFEGRARRTGVTIAPFTLEDYRSYIDGRPREEAIRAWRPGGGDRGRQRSRQSRGRNCAWPRQAKGRAVPGADAEPRSGRLSVHGGPDTASTRPRPQDGG